MLDLIQLLFTAAAAGSWPAALVLCVMMPIGLPLLASMALVVVILTAGVAVSLIFAMGYLLFTAVSMAR